MIERSALRGIGQVGRRGAFVAPLLVCLLVSGFPSATAGDAGRNGRIAFLRNRDGVVDVFTVEPSGMTPP